ncbi:MAG: aminodeoxychorismate/anthranilate synthase component II [Deltaproteobacteria bacterium]|jgi:anthranilate synthase component 2|nr:aminodeoxychorismate/anthranilate synthase component II [Deltaproteobacteria bacterium]
MKILLFDCHDSFTFNLAHCLKTLMTKGDRLDVITCSELNVSSAGDYDRIILSPGPGIPQEAGCLMELIDRWAISKPFLGVCLGHQALAQAFGASLVNLPKVFHGVKSSLRQVKKTRLFEGLPERFEGGRYHSWLVSRISFPTDLEVTCVDEEGSVMGFQHRALDLHGVQFHPESILTPLGPTIIANFLQDGGGR